MLLLRICVYGTIAADERVVADCVFYRCWNLRGRRDRFLHPDVRHDPAVGQNDRHRTGRNQEHGRSGRGD